MVDKSITLDSSNQSDLGYAQIIDVLWRRRYCLFGVLTGILAVAIPTSLTIEPTYQSSMQLMVESNYENKKTGNEGNFDFTDSKYVLDYATQQNLMHSSVLLAKAVEKLQGKYPDLNVDDLKQDLYVYQVKNENESGNKVIDTKIFQVDYDTDSPVKAQKVLEVIEQVYQEYNLEQQEKKLKKGLKFINEQLPEARRQLVKAQTDLKDFRLKHNIVAPRSEVEQLVANLREIKQERRILDSQFKEKEARYQELAKQLGIPVSEMSSAARLSESERYQNLLNRIQQTELELKEQRAQFKEDSPVILSLLERKAQQQTMLEEEAQRVLGEASSDMEITMDSLQNKGQLGESTLELANTINATRTDLQTLGQRKSGFLEVEQALSQELNLYPSIINEYDGFLLEVGARQATLKKLVEAKQELSIEINRGVVNWQVIEAPRLGEKVGPNNVQNFLLSGVIATLCGIMAVFIRETSDNKIYSYKMLGEQVTVPVLGNAPSLSVEGNEKFFIKLPFQTSEFGSTSILETVQWMPFRDAIDLVYENIQLINSSSALKSLVITSAVAQEGKSTISLGLALSAARRKKKVLIIDANLRNPSLHQVFNADNSVGFSDLLTQDLPEAMVTQNISLVGSSIDLLSAGSAVEDPVYLLSSPKLRKLIAKFEEEYDLVLLDVPSVIGKVDAILTASSCSATVMVVRLDRATSSELVDAMSLLNRLEVLGVIANSSQEARHTNKQKLRLPERAVSTAA